MRFDPQSYSLFVVVFTSYLLAAQNPTRLSSGEIGSEMAHCIVAPTASLPATKPIDASNWSSSLDTKKSENPSTALVALRRSENSGFDWNSATRQTFFLLSIQHTARLAQKKTRDELGGRFFGDWFGSVSNLHGWNDGDSVWTNYVGHPVHSSWSGFIQIQNDPKGRTREFNDSPDYWRSRFKALAWSQLYEIQWHAGPISEASIGHVGKKPHTLGYVNLVTSAPGGFGMIVLEDYLDKRVIERKEKGTNSLLRRRIYRVALNPGRAFANVLRLRKPWFRDTRPIDWEMPGGDAAGAGAQTLP